MTVSPTESAHVCTLCGLVQAVDNGPVDCGHPGWPYGPGFVPDIPHLRATLMRRDPSSVIPYSGDVRPGLTDPAYHRLMATA